MAPRNKWEAAAETHSVRWHIANYPQIMTT